MTSTVIKTTFWKAELRDTSLPRLISGQLRLPEAQAAVKDGLA